MITRDDFEDCCRERALAAHSASKRQPPPAPYTAADPPVPPEPAILRRSPAHHAAAFTAEILADAIFERAASDGALHRDALIEVLRRYGIAP